MSYSPHTWTTGETITAGQLNQLEQGLAGVAAASGVTGGGTSATDHIVFVSRTGNDVNDGLSWATAKATVAAGLSRLSSAPGTVMIGAGTFPVSGLNPNGVRIQGAGQGATVLSLPGTGTLLNLVNSVGVTVADLTLTFGSSAITGTLALFSNAFGCNFERVQFLGLGSIGQGVSGQTGVRFTANAGDNFFRGCFVQNLFTGVKVETVVNYFADCLLSGNRTAVLGGDSTGNPSNGLVIRGCTFAEAGDYYININGAGQAWIVESCWFDGTATTAIQVGAGTFGPWLFSLTNCPGVAGSSKSLVLNASDYTLVRGVQFIDGGTAPTVLTVNAANCPFGEIGQCNDTQGSNLDQLVPATWEGAHRYVTSADGTIRVLQSFTTTRLPDYTPIVHKRALVSVTGRTSGATQQVLTFPAPFTATPARVSDTTGKAPTASTTTLTFPAGVSPDGVVLIEGF